MADCEILFKDGDPLSINAEFDFLPRIGEQITVQIKGDRDESFVVENVVHRDVQAHGESARPRTQVWVRR